jgi:hypothetical protein
VASRGRSASQSDQLGFRGAVENPARGRFGIVLARQDGFEAFHDKLPSRSLDRRDAGVQRLGDPAVAPSLAGLRHVRFQKDASFGQQMRGALAPADKVVEPGALLFAQLDYVLLDANLWPGYESSPSRNRQGIDSDNPVKLNDVSH